MAAIDEMVNDAELIVNYAATNKLALPDKCIATLLSAKGREAVLAAPGKDRDDFYCAFNAAAVALDTSVASIRAAQLRRQRLCPLVADAHRLLDFAAANAKLVDDDIRNPLLDGAEAVVKGSPNVKDEQGFLKAYQALSTKTAPVTAETLEASRSNLPTIVDPFSWREWAVAWKGLTLGRFFNAGIFIVVLLATCISLGYYSAGSTGLARFVELSGTITKLEAGLRQKQDQVEIRENATTAKGYEAKSDEEKAAAREKLIQIKRDAQADKASIEDAKNERTEIPSRLWKWSQLPCATDGSFPGGWVLCSPIDAAVSAASHPSELQMVEAARSIAYKLSSIYLPLLFGWLGAHAFILRQMTKEIGENSFAKSSALRHIVRIGLGALAGFAASFLLTPGQVSSSLKDVPSWALSFIAGYGIELVFSFMDRIIGAFTTKSS